MSYAAHKERARKRQASQSARDRDIFPIPPIADPRRRAQTSRSLRAFCEQYQSAIYHLPWSQDHLRIIERIERATLEGYLCAFAMPRGSGKTCLCESAVLWATLTGHTPYTALIGADESHAEQNLQAIQSQLTTNDILAGDFPEVCYPIQRLEGIHQRKLLYNGRTITYEITKNRIVLPSIPGSKSASAIIQTAGLTGRIRGMKYARPDGRNVRPSLVLIDDPQTDDSARSPTQCKQRESVLSGAVLGLAGPGQKISGIMPCTVIRPNDMADAVLDRNKHPEWRGERTKLVYSFPTNTQLWERYAELREEGLRAEDDGAAATEFYRANRADMDAGAVVAWPQRHHPDELSALQHAINLRLVDEAAFYAEYQNDPLPENPTDVAELTPDQIAAKINRMQRGAVAIGSQHITMFIDVHGSLLYWCVCAWGEEFTGQIVDYGTWPEQWRAYFSLRDARQTIADATQAAGLEGQIYAALDTLTRAQFAREWKRDDNARLRIDRCLIDANWGDSTNVVYQFCRQSPHAHALMPSHGLYVGASSTPMAQHTRTPGERVGLNWRLPNVQRKRQVRHVVFDTNFWKSFVHTRLSVAMGDKGCLTLFGEKPATHRLFADHLTSEYRERTEGRGRTVDEWKLKPNRDNHWLDCLVGCAVAASMAGAKLPESGASTTSPPNLVSFRELQKRAKDKNKHARMPR